MIPPTAIDVPLPIERIPVQQGTDLEYLRELAERHGYVFYVMPGPSPFTNIAYWGPPIRVGLPQRAITVNMGPETNAKLDEAAHGRPRGRRMVEGEVQDRQHEPEGAGAGPFGSLRPPLAVAAVLARRTPGRTCAGEAARERRERRRRRSPGAGRDGGERPTR